MALPLDHTRAERCRREAARIAERVDDELVISNFVLRPLLRIVARPDTRSDGLLMLSDYLREVAEEYELALASSHARIFRRLADWIADLAPGRAD